VNAGAFVILFHHELAVLDTLPAWVTRLFVLLIRSSNYRTGAGSTTYRELADGLRPLQPGNGGPRHFVPQRDTLRAYLRALELAGLVKRTGASSRGESLFFELAPRSAKVRPASSSSPGFVTPPDALEN